MGSSRRRWVVFAVAPAVFVLAAALVVILQWRALRRAGDAIERTRAEVAPLAEEVDRVEAYQEHLALVERHLALVEALRGERYDRELEIDRAPSGPDDVPVAGRGAAGPGSLPRVAAVFEVVLRHHPAIGLSRAELRDRELRLELGTAPAGALARLREDLLALDEVAWIAADTPGALDVVLALPSDPAGSGE